jgi:hypothetical protein
MIIRDLTRDVCPVCRRATTLAVIEPHQTRKGLEIHTFNCDGCGRLKSKVVETPMVGRTQILAAGSVS